MYKKATVYFGNVNLLHHLILLHNLSLTRHGSSAKKQHTSQCIEHNMHLESHYSGKLSKEQECDTFSRVWIGVFWHHSAATHLGKTRVVTLL